jgi:ComF family protein
VVATDYIAPLDQLVLALKFGGKLALAPLFARLLADALLRFRTVGALPGLSILPASTTLPALLAGVPLSTSRLTVRGFNQSLEIARPLARLTGIALAPQLLLRVRDTRPQSLLAPEQRRSNIAGAFDVAPRHADRIGGLHVAVVDDVITTGHTLNEIAATLKRYGTARVTNLVFARTLR